MSPARTIEESQARRRELILDALYYRRKKQPNAVKACRNCATLEKLNQRYFLGEPPF
jgi:hypothetical protein